MKPKQFIGITSAQIRILKNMMEFGSYVFEDETNGKLSYCLATISDDLPHGYSYRCTNGHKTLNKNSVFCLITIGLLEQVTVWPSYPNSVVAYRANCEKSLNGGLVYKKEVSYEA